MLQLDDLQDHRSGRWLFHEFSQWLVTGVRNHRVSPPHMEAFRRPELCINLTLRGRGRYVDDAGRTHEIGPGTLVQRLPGRMHSSHYEPDSGYLELLWVTDPDTATHLIGAGFIRPETVLNLELDQAVIEEFRRLSSRIDAPESQIDSRRVLLEFVTAISALYDRVGSRRVRGLWDTTIRKAQQLIEQDLEGSASLEDIAARLKVSYGALRAEFRREVGVSLGAYRIAKRMESARRLLRNHSVTQVAGLLGYADAARFCKQFKQRFGLTPGRFQHQPRPPWMG